MFSEGGPTIAGDLLARRLADEVVIFTSPKPFGRPGVPMLSVEARRLLDSGEAYRSIEEGRSGTDHFRHLERMS